MTCIKSGRYTKEPCDHAEGCANKKCLHRKPHEPTVCWEREETYCFRIEAMTRCPTRKRCEIG